MDRHEGWTPALAQVVARATELARELGHRRVGSEHLLLALLDDTESTAAVVLAGLKVDRAGLERELREVMPHRGGRIEGEVPLTESATGALRRAETLAQRLGAALADTDHLLLGIAGQHEGAGSRVLLDFGATTERIRRLVEREMVERQMQRCPQCGTPLNPSWRYCPMCGVARVGV